MVEQVFIHWAKTIADSLEPFKTGNVIVIHPNALVERLAPLLETDFKVLYAECVQEDDDYIHKDEVMEYVRDNYDPPEYDR